MATPKYRPSLTIQQMQYLLSLAEVDEREATQNIRQSTVASLKVFLVKATIGSTQLAYTAAEKKTMMDKLGFDADTPVQKRAKAFILWKESPEFCTEEQVKDAQMHRYLNDMMTAEEAEEFEAKEFVEE